MLAIISRLSVFCLNSHLHYSFKMFGIIMTEYYPLKHLFSNHFYTDLAESELSEMFFHGYFLIKRQTHCSVTSKTTGGVSVAQSCVVFHYCGWFYPQLFSSAMRFL